MTTPRKWILAVVIVLVGYMATAKFGIESVRHAVAQTQTYHTVNIQGHEEVYPYQRGLYAYPILPLIVWETHEFVFGQVGHVHPVRIKGDGYWLWYIFGSVALHTEKEELDN